MMVLLNAWSGGSAKIFEKEGFNAVGTSSAGIAYSKGLADGEDILKVVNIPVTVDMERGYSEKPLEVSRQVEQIIQLGAVGINIEDGIPELGCVDSIEVFEEKVRAIAALKKTMGYDFFINARIDLFLMQTASQEEMIKETIARAKRLKDCGADGIFVPGPLDQDTIKQLKEGIELPLNLYLHTCFNDLEVLENMGINRLSTGSAHVRTLIDCLIDQSKALKNGQVTSMLSHEMTYGACNTYFSSNQ